jgi:manganese/zinc/iron transport system permease protein
MIFHYLDYTCITVMLGTAIIGCIAGILGCYVFLREQSLFADAISHAALPGMALMFLVTHTTSVALLLLGGTLSGALGIAFVHLVLHTTKLKQDAILGVVLSVFFGVGLIIVSYIQKTGIGQQAIINKFLFGDPSALARWEVVVIALIAITIIGLLSLCWKEFLMILFDPSFAQSNRYRVYSIQALLTLLVIIVVSIGLQLVGAIVISTLFIAPALAARQWTNNFFAMILLAGFLGSTSGIVGTMLSRIVDKMPTGPTVVLVSSTFVFGSLFVRRGTKKWLRNRVSLHG